MFAIIRCRMFCLQVDYTKCKAEDTQKYNFACILYGCETWSLTLRVESRLRVFEKRLLRRIIGPKTEEVPGEWRKLHNEELNELYLSPNIIRMTKSEKGEACITYGEEKTYIRAFGDET